MLLEVMDVVTCVLVALFFTAACSLVAIPLFQRVNYGEEALINRGRRGRRVERVSRSIKAANFAVALFVELVWLATAPQFAIVGHGLRALWHRVP